MKMAYGRSAYAEWTVLIVRVSHVHWQESSLPRPQQPISGTDVPSSQHRRLCVILKLPSGSSGIFPSSDGGMIASQFVSFAIRGVPLSPSAGWSMRRKQKKSWSLYKRMAHWSYRLGLLPLQNLNPM